MSNPYGYCNYIYLSTGMMCGKPATSKITTSNGITETKCDEHFRLTRNIRG